MSFKDWNYQSVSIFLKSYNLHFFKIQFIRLYTLPSFRGKYSPGVSLLPYRMHLLGEHFFIITKKVGLKSILFFIKMKKRFACSWLENKGWGWGEIIGSGETLKIFCLVQKKGELNH